MPPNQRTGSRPGGRSSPEAEHCSPLAYLIPGLQLVPWHRPPHHPLAFMCVPVSRLLRGFVLAVPKRSRVAPTLPSPAGLVGSFSLPSGDGYKPFSSRSPRLNPSFSVWAVICTHFSTRAETRSALGTSSTRRATVPVAPPPRPIGCAEGTYRSPG